MSNTLINAIADYAAHSSNRVALETVEGKVTYRDLLTRITEMCEQLQASSVKHLGILCDNGCLWVVAQLSALACGIPVTPIPGFFSPAQQRHLLTQSGIDCLIADNPADVQNLNLELAPHSSLERHHNNRIARAFYLSSDDVSLPKETALVTYTSGTTGQPKGVCLSFEHLLQVSWDLAQLVNDQEIKRHLCLMPLSVLLENIAGLFVPLLLGKTVILYPSASLGLSGSSQLNMVKFASALTIQQPDSLIVTPELLKVLVHLLTSGQLQHRPKYIALGGSRVSNSLLQAAVECGLNVYQGYGLSECGSVVTLNTPEHHRLGSVGKPLPSCRVEIARDGEIWVHGSHCLGYLGEKQIGEEQGAVFQHGVATGDLGYLDSEDFLYIHGRKKNHIITSFGRNIAPEWPEAELCASGSIQQACVVGDGQAFLTAIIHPLPRISATDIQQTLNQVNQRLPDYAQISTWIPADEAFSVANGQLTNNGRFKREVIAAAYRRQIREIYDYPRTKTS